MDALPVSSARRGERRPRRSLSSVLERGTGWTSTISPSSASILLFIQVIVRKYCQAHAETCLSRRLQHSHVADPVYRLRNGAFLRSELQHVSPFPLRFDVAIHRCSISVSRFQATAPLRFAPTSTRPASTGAALQPVTPSEALGIAAPALRECSRHALSQGSSTVATSKPVYLLSALSIDLES